MVNFDLINLSADAVVIVIIATSYRMHMNKLVKLEEKTLKTLSRDETKELIDEEIAAHLAIIQCAINSIKDTLDKITVVTAKS